MGCGDMVTKTGEAFAKALSLALPNTSIPYRAVASLARAVVDEARRGLAMDASADPLREAMDELEETLNRTVPNARDRQAVFDMCARVAGAARDSASAPQRDMESYATRSSATSGAGPNPSTFGQKPEGDWPDGPDRLGRTGGYGALVVSAAGAPGQKSAALYSLGRRAF
jgi:hypothetical protein